MVDRSVDLKLGEIIGQNQMILRELDIASESRITQELSLNLVKDTAVKLDTRVAVVEEILVNYRPTIEEFLDIKKKVIGAGKLGKWLWGAVAALIGIIFAVRTELFGWLSK